MKAKKNTAFTVTIVAIYVLTVVMYVASLFVEYRKGEEKAVNRFNDITRDVSRISLAYQPRSEKFYDEILSSLGNISDIAGLQLNFGNELIFSYPRDMQELNSIRNYLVFQRTTKVFASSGIPVSIKASIYKLKPSSIYYKGRIAFIVIFAATLVTAFYLVLYVRNGTFPTEAENDDLDEDEMEYPDVSTYDLTPEETSEINNQLSSMNAEAENESAEIESDEPSEDFMASEEPVEEEEKEEDVLAFLNDKKNDEQTETETFEPAGTSEQAEQPKGLFCPETGFGWEEYMITRLDSELLRSASSDQDISLFTIKIPGIDWTSECGKKLSKIIIEQVKFNDLVFHHGDDGVSAIIQNQNTDQALMTADSLKSYMDKALDECGSNLKTAIGISTRSLRLISASRLANESEEALKRALSDPDSPIIAFRVNPERYKDFLASESFQEKDRPVEKGEDEKLLEDLPEPPAEEDDIPEETMSFDPEESVPPEVNDSNEPVPEPLIDDDKKEKSPFDELEDFDIDEELKI
ncbi:MAG: hypothetical protein KBS64_06550 [Treponema sp.]|nr:hypothetical protein [Candidatus Treponema equi]